MKVTEVRYERLINLGNFNNVKYGVTIMLDEEGDSPEAAMTLAKELVEKTHKEQTAQKRTVSIHSYDRGDEYDDELEVEAL